MIECRTIKLTETLAPLQCWNISKNHNNKKQPIKSIYFQKKAVTTLHVEHGTSAATSQRIDCLLFTP
ncbi:MAG: hypothetical protein CFE24_12325 [Flavobacterium sp. BFFFF2]|nr:MAG: hypothetical protein CFE24_12325 [Flavobacterium sp. BFFFF2]